MTILIRHALCSILALLPPCAFAVANPSAPLLQIDRQIGRDVSNGTTRPIHVFSEGEGFRVYFQDEVSLNTVVVDVNRDLVATPVAASADANWPACLGSIDAQSEHGPHVLCRNISRDAQGSYFYVDGHSDEIVAMARDGQRHTRPLGFDAAQWLSTATAGNGAGAVFAIPTATNRIELRAVDARMNVIWQLDVGEFSADTRVHWAAQGANRVLVRTQAARLRIDRVASDGVLSPQADRALAAGQAAYNVSLDSAGNVFVVLIDLTARSTRLWRVSDQGIVTHDTALDCNLGLTVEFSWPSLPPVCVPVSHGVHTHWLALAEDSSFALFKSQGDAAPLLAWSSADPVFSMALSNGGASLLIAEDQTNGLNPVARLVHVGYDDPALIDPAVVTPQPRAVTHPVAHLLEDGLLVNEQEGFDSAALRRFDSSGQLLWRRALPTQRAYAGSSDSQVCAASSTAYVLGTSAQADVACYRASDGEMVLDSSIAEVRIATAGTLPMQQIGHAFVFVRADVAEASTRLYRLRQGQTPLQIADHFKSPRAWLDGQDRLFVIDEGTTPMRFDRYDAGGNVLATGNLSTAVLHLNSAKFDAQDRLWINFSGVDTGTANLARLDETGGFAGGTSRVVSGPHIASILPLGNSVLVLIKRLLDGSQDGAPDSALYAINADGSERWTRFARSDLPSMLAVHVSPQTVQVLEAGLTPTPSWRIAAFDASTGDVLAPAKNLPWPAQLQTRLPDALGRGEDRFAFVGDDGNTLALGSVGLEQGAVIADIASALTGAWSIPGLSGQGLAFEHNAAVGMLSAAWYAHDPVTAGSVDHNALRWHTLLGAVPGSETFEMQMSIFENSGGAFDDLPTTTSTQVGLATLRVTGCDRMTLSYAIGDDQSTPRMFALQRASPRTTPCTLRLPNSGVSTTTAASYVPQTDLGGAWYEQRTSGQGLHIVVYPPGGSNAQETLGLGWFTYDPTGSADEATQQHWFTASGRFDDATGQNASLTIYRTTGGDRETMPTRNTHRVGTATLERIDCDSATLTYQFDDTLVAAAFSTRSRAVPLQRLGGCRHHVAGD